MDFKGLDKLREKLPDYPGRRIAILPIRGVFAAIIVYIFLIILDILPRIFNSILFLAQLEPYLPLIGNIFVAGLGLWLIWGVWNKREQLRELYGDLAYQKIIPRGVVGVFMIPPIVFHAFTSIRSLPPVPPVNNLTIQLSKSLLSFTGVPVEIDIWFRIITSGILIIIGALTVRSALLTFGIDYMTVVYLYFPDESEIQDNEIYSVIRHPTYLAGIILGLAGLFSRFSIYSILMFFTVYLVFKLQIWKEEKELVERFGEGYNEYRKQVPALFVRPSKLGAFFRFLRPT